MASVDEEIKKLTGRSKKVKNLEEEVEFILSQDESDEENNCDANKEEIIMKTPSTFDKVKELLTPRASQAKLNELQQTPRRSCRKSVKPSQDYDDIVNRSLRICTRSGKKNLPFTSEELVEVEANKENESDHKWTPAKVGRVSQKRGRKSRRNGKGKKKENEDLIETEELNTTRGDENISHEQLINVVPENGEENGTTENTSQTASDVKLENVESMEEEQSEKSIHLIQEDTEDAKEFIQKSSEEDICIIFENNISNEEINTENEENVEHSKKEDVEESCFGSYLKTNINISDLGLNPIKDEDDEIKKDTELFSEDAEEMPSLIVCDDDDDDEEERDNENKKLNETFEANNSLELVKNEDVDTMETLEISDDEFMETPKKMPRIVLTDTAMQNQTLLSTPKTKLPPTPKPLATPKMLTTPKQLVKAYRFPTPYRTEKNLKFTRAKIENNDKLITEKTSNTTMLSITTLQPKEIILRSIRKRSLSVCIDGNDNDGKKFLPNSSKNVKQDRMVSFYSPANQTAIIDELDIIIAKSLKKQKPPQQTKGALNNNVTTRRKRSMSLDDSMMSSSQASKLPRPVVKQNINETTTSTSKPLMRTKLPNFAAIHQKNFKKMENLVDHINRKQERSKNLINSATKLKVSAQKNVSIIKNSSLMEKPKALKKIDLGKAQINKSLNVSSSSSSIAARTVNRAQDILNAEKINKLPDPRKGLPLAVKTVASTQKSNKQPQIDKYLKTVQKTTSNSSAVELKPNFNLSTTLTNNQDKMASRLQRHMDLFKARDVGVAARKKDILRGVRSNRRFELQMQHRRNMEQ